MATHNAKTSVLHIAAAELSEKLHALEEAIEAAREAVRHRQGAMTATSSRGALTSGARAARYEAPALSMIAGRFAARSVALVAATSQTIT